MGLKEKIYEDLKISMKKKEEVNVRTLRMVIAAIKNFEVDNKNMTDEDVVTILNKEMKTRKDSIEQYTAAGRKDLADEEQKEMDVIKDYLPEALTEDELRKLILDTITEVGAKGAADLGKVMGKVMGKVKGRADGKIINQMVRELLSNV